jgi:hypothetical protein
MRYLEYLLENKPLILVPSSLGHNDLVVEYSAT